MDPADDDVAQPDAGGGPVSVPHSVQYDHLPSGGPEQGSHAHGLCRNQADVLAGSYICWSKTFDEIRRIYYTDVYAEKKRVIPSTVELEDHMCEGRTTGTTSTTVHLDPLPYVTRQSMGHCCCHQSPPHVLLVCEGGVMF